MNEAIMSLFVVATYTAFAFTSGFFTGRAIGESRGRTIGRKIGRDEGWNEREIDRINEQHRRNYARRGRDGKFNGGAV